MEFSLKDYPDLPQPFSVNGKRCYNSKDIKKLPPEVYAKWVFARSTEKVDEVLIDSRYKVINYIFTKCKWWVALLIWLPVSVWFLYPFTYQKIPFFLAGFIVAFPVEYYFHKYIFHLTVRGEQSKKLQFLLHGSHHAAPKDLDHIISPPTDVIWYLLPIYILFRLFHVPHVDAIISGATLSYLRYDMSHYLIHRYNLSTLSRIPLVGSFLAKIKKAHMYHHYMDATKNFAISFPLPSNCYADSVGISSEMNNQP